MPSKIKPLIVILSCIKNNNLWDNLLKIDVNSIIFCADFNQNEDYILKDRVLYLKCKDTYDALPEKILMMIKAVLNIKEFNDITHIYKLDDHDTSWNKSLENTLIEMLSKTNIDYGGQEVHYMGRKYNSFKGSTKWHFGKCDQDSIWHNKIYDGPYTPWAGGGSGYILSRKSMYLINDNCPNTLDKIRENYIYEDLMIGLILYEESIYPQKTDLIIEVIDVPIKIVNTDFYFIHIPKNAGTSFIKTYCNDKQLGHYKANEINDNELLKRTVAIFRNPYERLYSIYVYTKKDNSYWHGEDKKYGILPLYDYCKAHTFKEFVDDLYSGKIKLSDQVHLIPQVEFLKAGDNKIYTTLARFDYLEEDLSKILQLSVSLPKINKSLNGFNLDQEYDSDMKQKVYQLYKDDFVLLDNLNKSLQNNSLNKSFQFLKRVFSK